VEKQQYLLFIQYLGFRYHGFQKQTNAKTVQEMLDRTLNYVLEERKFKTFSSSRTDTMVSANKMSILLTTHGKVDSVKLLKSLNYNLPPDIKALSLEPQNDKINIIGDVREKTYHYYFCYGEKMNPLAAPYMTNIMQELDIPLMIDGINSFKGEKNFKHFCYKGNEDKVYIRELSDIQLIKNESLRASFFPKESYVLIVKGKGFLRHQIRLMMGALFNLGMHKVTIDELDACLKNNYEGKTISFLAPASGLILEDLVFEKTPS